jgi:hydrogenase-4 component B
VDSFQLIILSLILTLSAIILIPVLPSVAKSKANFIFIFLNAIITSFAAIYSLSGGWPHTDIVTGSLTYGNIIVRIDPLSAWFMLIINITCTTGALYGIGYMKVYSVQKANLSMHWVMFQLFHASMLWVCMLQTSLAFLVAWEIMSISSFFLVIFEHQNRNTLKAGIKYLVQMHIGIIFLMIAFLWVYISNPSASYSFYYIGSYFENHPNFWLFLLFFIGFGIKAGFIPLHSWLPHAHPAAPSHISGVMSGVIVKLGIYGIIRISLMLKNDQVLIGESLLIISLLSGVYGILNAALHRDFKKMLAYCTIENIGIIGAGTGLAIIGMGTGSNTLVVIGLCVALLHALNHSLFKSLLFYSAGSIYQQTHTRDMEKLGGLIKKMPQTAIFFLVGSLAIGGLPPFNGFVSEFLLYSGFLHGLKTMSPLNEILMIMSIAVLVIIGGLSLLTFTKTFGIIFLGSARRPIDHAPSEVSWVMRIPQVLIIAIILSIGLFPAFYFTATLRIAWSFTDQYANKPAHDTFLPLITLISNIGLYSALFLIMLILVSGARYALTKNREVKTEPTWGCGYAAPAPQMQYTGKSFAKILSRLFWFAGVEKKKFIELSPNEIFPEPRKYASHFIDFLEDKILNPVTNRLVSYMNYFQFIQNGKIQMYVLYGVFFFILVLLGTVLNII